MNISQNLDDYIPTDKEPFYEYLCDNCFTWYPSDKSHHCGFNEPKILRITEEVKLK